MSPRAPCHTSHSPESRKVTRSSSKSKVLVAVPEPSEHVNVIRVLLQSGDQLGMCLSSVALSLCQNRHRCRVERLKAAFQRRYEVHE